MRKQQVTFPELYCGGSKTRTQTSACLNSKTHIVSVLRFWFYPSHLFFSGNSTLLFQKQLLPPLQHVDYLRSVSRPQLIHLGTGTDLRRQCQSEFFLEFEFTLREVRRHYIPMQQARGSKTEQFSSVCPPETLCKEREWSDIKEKQGRKLAAFKSLICLFPRPPPCPPSCGQQFHLPLSLVRQQMLNFPEPVQVLSPAASTAQILVLIFLPRKEVAPYYVDFRVGSLRCGQTMLHGVSALETVRSTYIKPLQRGQETWLLSQTPHNVLGCYCAKRQKPQISLRKEQNSKPCVFIFSSVTFEIIKRSAIYDPKHFSTCHAL